MIPGSANPLLLKSAAAAGGYQVSRSLRFNSSDSAFCSRTPAVAGNRRTWTWAGWVKIASFARTHFLFGAENTFAAFNSNGTSSDCELYFNLRGSSTNYFVSYAPKLRDPSAWYHLVFAVDTTQGTPANILKVYINGVQATAAGGLGQSFPPQNDILSVNNTVAHTICGSYYFDGYLADIHFIDGQALTPSSFTEVSATTGQLIPKTYTGTFGTNGFWLKFSDNSAATAATLGKDYSGNSNNWTPNNLSVTAGAGNDSLVDTPTSTGTDTGVGNEVRGNYATWNPLANGATLSNGNLDITGPASGYGGSISTIALDSGKYYWEYTVTNNYAQAAICGISARTVAPFSSLSSADEVYYQNNYVVTNGSTTSGLNTIVAGDVIGITWDGSSNQIKFYRNNSLQTTVTASSGKTYFAGFGGIVNNTASINFGQRAFAYPVSGYKALVDTNLGAPVVAKPNTLMDVVLYTGTGATQTLPNANSTPSTPLAFSPDLVWLKDRSGGGNHNLYDSVRGATLLLYPSFTLVEGTSSGLTAFTSDGFTLGANQSSDGNLTGRATVAWCWDAGTSTVSNTSGSITSQVRANVSAGFSIVNYTGNGATGTVGHGLGVTPSFIIIKGRDSATNWFVWSIGSGSGVLLEGLNNTNAGSAGYLGGSAPTSTVFSVSGGVGINGPGVKHIAYCFSSVVGYSSFGSYTGNGSADGPFVYTGFRPRWVMVKGSTYASNWNILDAARDPYNLQSNRLRPNLSNAEESTSSGTYAICWDALSNGFKLRGGSGTNDVNQTGETLIYAAFAESPFQYARAR